MIHDPLGMFTGGERICQDTLRRHESGVRNPAASNTFAPGAVILVTKVEVSGSSSLTELFPVLRGLIHVDKFRWESYPAYEPGEKCVNCGVIVLRPRLRKNLS